MATKIAMHAGEFANAIDAAIQRHGANTLEAYGAIDFLYNCMLDDASYDRISDLHVDIEANEPFRGMINSLGEVYNLDRLKAW